MSRIAGAAHQYHALVGHARCLTRHQGVVSVEVSEAVILRRVVEGIVTQRGVDDVHAHTVGKLDRRCPIVLLYQVLGILVFAAQQPEGGFGCGTYHHVGTVHSDARQYAQAVAALGIDVGRGVHKVLYPQNADILHGRYTVDVMIAGVYHGYRHALPAEACLVQLVAPAHLYLRDGCPIDAVAIDGRTIHQRVAPFGEGRAFGSRPYLLGHADKGERKNASDKCSVVARDGDKVIPLTRHHHVHALPAYFVDILAANGQVGRVDGQMLFAPAFDGLRRKEFFGSVQAILRGSLVFQTDAILQRILLCPCSEYGKSTGQ